MGALETEAVFVTDKSNDASTGLQNRRRYSKAALEELLVNALVHRDYRNPLSTRVNVFSDRIEIENPSGGPSPSIKELESGTTRWHNPSLSRYLFELGLAQERGTGIPKAIQETVLVAGDAPDFHVDTWFKVTIPAYRPPALRTQAPLASPGAGVLIVSIGHGTIDTEIIRRSNSGFRDLRDEQLCIYEHAGVVSGDQWSHIALELRDWVRNQLELPQFKEFHLFYRGPVAFGPLLGAVAVGRRPVVVYYFDEEEGVYRSAYRIDRNLMQAK
jgi:hypothetical protein